MGHRDGGLLPDVGFLGFHRRAALALPWHLAFLTRRGNSPFVVRQGTRCGRWSATWPQLLPAFVVRQGTRCGPALPWGRCPRCPARRCPPVPRGGDSLPGLDDRAARVPLGPGPSRCLCSSLSGVFWLRLDPVRALPAPYQPLHGPRGLARGTGCGVLHLIAAVLVPLSPLGCVPQLGAQAVCAARDSLADCVRPLLPDGGTALGLLLDLVHATPPRPFRCRKAWWSSAGTAGCGGGSRPGRARWRCRI